MMNSKESLNNIKRTMIIGRHGNIDVGNKYNKMNQKKMIITN